MEVFQLASTQEPNWQQSQSNSTQAPEFNSPDTASTQTQQKTVLLTIPLLLHDVTADVDMFHVSGAMVM
jgi:hypothetical protein